MNALFRIENMKNGKILIDGVDISTIPLQSLRSKIGIIPQDPVMFSATVRFNLDPLDAHTDEEVWEVSNSLYIVPSAGMIFNYFHPVYLQFMLNSPLGPK